MSSNRLFKVKISITKDYTLELEDSKGDLSDEMFAKRLEDKAYEMWSNSQGLEYKTTYGESTVWFVGDKGDYVIYADLDDCGNVILHNKFEDNILKNQVINLFENTNKAEFMEWMDLTSEQRESVLKVVARQGIDKLLAIYAPTSFTPWVGLSFEHIYIGVEVDGHSHS